MSAEPPSLEEQLKALRAQVMHLRYENSALRSTIKHLSDDEWEEAVVQGHRWLAAKVESQRWAINAIQWRGWEPEFVIQEQETPEDFYVDSRSSRPTAARNSLASLTNC